MTTARWRERHRDSDPPFPPGDYSRGFIVGMICGIGIVVALAGVAWLGSVIL